MTLNGQIVPDVNRLAPESDFKNLIGLNLSRQYNHIEKNLKTELSLRRSVGAMAIGPIPGWGKNNLTPIASPAGVIRLGNSVPHAGEARSLEDFNFTKNIVDLAVTPT